MKKFLLLFVLILSYTNASVTLVLKNLEPKIKKQGDYFLLDKSNIDNKDINSCIIYDNNKTANIICSVKKEIFAEVAIVPIIHSKNGNLIFLENFIKLTPLKFKK